jgi:ATP-dependent helicase/nuclease subunit B
MRLISGPAGSGKTFRCLAEIRESLCTDPEGLPLLLISPKQNTYLLERQLLSGSSLAGYTRLHILSFERLAHLIFEWLGQPVPKMIDEQGRLMVMRAIIAKKQDALKLFRASSKLTGFAQQLSQVLKELQQKRLTPQTLRSIARKTQDIPGLCYKLQDFAILLEEYLAWLETHKLRDSDSLIDQAIQALTTPAGLRPAADRDGGAQLDLFSSQRRKPHLLFDRLWVDGFAQFSEQEIAMLAALAPYGREGTLMFCLDSPGREENSWLSTWSLVGSTYRECRKRLSTVLGLKIETEVLARDWTKNRFTGNPVFQHLEEHWEAPHPYVTDSSGRDQTDKLMNSSVEACCENIRIVTCSNPQEEAILAGREILRYVRSGGRFRETTVLVRKLSEYLEPLQRVFSRFQIPFFMDQREPISHHPLPELTRNALRTILFGWLHDDWFAALKTGLVHAEERDIDKLENEALARGWKGNSWQKPLVIAGQPELTQWLEALRSRVLPPFQSLALALGGSQGRTTGLQMAQALRTFWESLRVEQQLQSWADREPVNSESGRAGSMHATVWEEMKQLLANLELAFASETLPLREWSQILEAGLGNLTVGVVPPALDQVLVGAIDRSRNPEIKLALVLGLNEGIFPARPETSVLLNESDKVELEKHGVVLSLTPRQQIAQERFLGYIAFTRASAKLVLSSSLQDPTGSPLNPSLFLRHLTRLFPLLHLETEPETLDWRRSEHPIELIGEILRVWQSSLPVGSKSLPEDLKAIPAVSAVLERLGHFREVRSDSSLRPDLASRLFGLKLRTSVSRLEQFAACPFKFFIHSGLKAEERKIFELDVKEQGLFQHDVLALFHEELRKQRKRWRDITSLEARELIGEIAAGLGTTYREGLLHASERSKFLLRLMTDSLQDFIETSVNWMRDQYQFNPVAVELPFDESWELDLDNGHHLALQGRIDRIDVFQDSENSAAQCVVVDYKSGQKKLDPLLLANGLQLQLLTYLTVVRRWRDPSERFGARTLIPAGVFYVSLRGQYDPEKDRNAALSDIEGARRMAYRHSGRFNVDVLRLLDSRPGARAGNQFNYRLNADGKLSKTCREALTTEAFETLLDSIEAQLKQMGQRIFSGIVDVAPYKRGSTTACNQCVYGGICRIDPWTHRFRVLTRSTEG